MTDYEQPDFYRFNEDSLILVKFISEQKLKAESLLDLGAGSGVIGIELALQLDVPMIHFLELQEDWRPFLNSNIERFIPTRPSEIFWTSVSKWKPVMKYDLIVSNPPYYLPGNGKVSPDRVRAHCRSFLQDNWGIFLSQSRNALAPGGLAFFVTAPENEKHIREVAGNSSVEFIPRESVLIVKLSSPE
jgi:tRNA1(Val) A37 N6-methylase TrmN6